MVFGFGNLVWWYVELLVCGLTGCYCVLRVCFMVLGLIFGWGLVVECCLGLFTFIGLVCLVIWFCVCVYADCLWYAGS